MWIRNKHKKRFSKVLEEHGNSLQRVAYSYSRTAHEQEDLEQEIALALWNALKHFKGECSLRTFAFRIAHNCCISQVIRSKDKHRRSAVHTELPETLTDHTLPIEVQLEQHQKQHQLHQAICQLPLAYKQVITLALEDCTHAEISEITGLTIANVGIRIHRAKQMLRAQLNKEST